MKLKVFGDRIVFRALPDDQIIEEKSAGGIIIPETVREGMKAQRRNYKGLVVMAGDKCEFIKEGDTVAYDEYGGAASFFHEGEELIIAREKDLIGLYE